MRALAAAHGLVELAVSDDDALLELRRLATVALTAGALRASCDVGVPVDRLGDILGEIERIGDAHGIEVATFAHAGDGNLHPGLRLPDESDASYALADRILGEIADAAVALGGTVSGEHGIGSLKLDAYLRTARPGVLAVQSRIKEAFDPNGILSPGRGIPLPSSPSWTDVRETPISASIS